MTKQVLVLCQRKTGNDWLGKVEDKIIPSIKNVVENLIGSDYDITYMTYIKDTTDLREIGECDINCKLDGITECSKNFISENKKSFDLIILQTCPFIVMDYGIIYNLLKFVKKISKSSRRLTNKISIAFIILHEYTVCYDYTGLLFYNCGNVLADYR
jgi:hypothetical protein